MISGLKVQNFASFGGLLSRERRRFSASWCSRSNVCFVGRRFRGLTVRLRSIDSSICFCRHRPTSVSKQPFGASLDPTHLLRARHGPPPSSLQGLLLLAPTMHSRRRERSSRRLGVQRLCQVDLAAEPCSCKLALLALVGRPSAFWRPHPAMSRRCSGLNRRSAA